MSRRDRDTRAASEAHAVPTDHVSHVVEREQQPGQLPRWRSTVTIVHGGEVVEHRTAWLPIERFVSQLAVQRGREREALLRWLGPGGR